MLREGPEAIAATRAFDEWCRRIDGSFANRVNVVAGVSAAVTTETVRRAEPAAQRAETARAPSERWAEATPPPSVLVFRRPLEDVAADIEIPRRSAISLALKRTIDLVG